MKISSIEKNVMENLRNISGENIERINNIFKALMMYSLMQYSEGEAITIPYFGTFKIEYKGDLVEEGLRYSDLDTKYFPSSEMRINIGYMEDIKRTGNTEEIVNIPIIKEIAKNLEGSLKGILLSNDEE